MHPSITRSFALLRFADFRRLWAIGALTSVARWLEFVAIAIYAYELTRSPELVALLAVFRMLPYVALGLIVGGLADAFDRKAMLVVSLVVMTAVALAMAALTAAHLGSYAAIAVVTMFSGGFWTIDMPVRRQLLVGAIEPGEMTSALGLDNATMYATRALGPLLGGLTYEFVGIQGIFVLIAGSYVVCLLLTFRLQSKPVDEPGRSVDHAPGAGDLEGSLARRMLAHVLPPRSLLANRRLQVILGVTLVYNLWCFPFVTMVPVIAQHDFGLSPLQVGALSACDGIGGMIGALIIGAMVTERTLFRVHYLGTFAFLVLMAALSLQLVVGTTIVALLLLGVAAASFSATQYALIYVISPPEMRGRATGLLSMFIGSSMLGHYHAGYLFERLGSVTAMQIMAAEGIVTLAIFGLLWRRTAAGTAPNAS